MMLLGFSSSSGGEAASTAALLKSTSRLDPSGNAAKPTYFVFYRHLCPLIKFPEIKSRRYFWQRPHSNFFMAYFFR